MYNTPVYTASEGGGNFLRDVALLLEPHGIAPPDCSGGEDGGVDTGAWQLAEASRADPVVFSGHPQDSRIAREVTLGQSRHHAARRRNDHLEADLADRDDAACPVVLNETPRLRELHDDVRSEATHHKATPRSKLTQTVESIGSEGGDRRKVEKRPRGGGKDSRHIGDDLLALFRQHIAVQLGALDRGPHLLERGGLGRA